MTQRRLTFQLAPLVDLLLIVIFAQYMEVQQSAADGRAELDRKRDKSRKPISESRLPVCRQTSIESLRN